MKIKQYAALAVVLACIGAGLILLMIDYDAATTKWAALISAFMFFGAGIGLGHLFDSKKLLPE
jgi:hypothetical protein